MTLKEELKFILVLPLMVLWIAYYETKMWSAGFKYRKVRKDNVAKFHLHKLIITLLHKT